MASGYCSKFYYVTFHWEEKIKLVNTKYCHHFWQFFPPNKHLLSLAVMFLVHQRKTQKGIVVLAGLAASCHHSAYTPI